MRPIHPQQTQWRVRISDTQFREKQIYENITIVELKCAMYEPIVLHDIQIHLWN